MKLPGLPQSEKGLDKFARAKWRGNPETSRQVESKTKRVWEYHSSLLPAAAQDRLTVIFLGPDLAQRQAEKEKRDALWAKYEALTEEHKATCEARFKVLHEVERLVRGGAKVADAVDIVCGEFEVSVRSYYNWRALVDGLDQQDWKAAMAPSFASATKRAECDGQAWDYLKSDYLRLGEPKFSACYRRMVKVAKKLGWIPIPSESALRRRLDAEVPEAVQILQRKGKEKAGDLHPAQRRSRSYLHAMQAVNMDGHKLDVFVKVPWSDKPVRFYIIGIQDLYSGKILSWRLSEAETWEAVRLAIGDMVEAFGLPEHIYIDNGKAFASKWITGDAVRRFRFKVKPEDPRGLLETLKIQPHFVRPYSGRSKPIERAWGDLAENISKHPVCDGAYTGNKPDAKPENYGTRAIPFEEFKAHVAAQIIEHNEQTGRRADNCKGRSFDETFAESMAQPSTIVRTPTAAQSFLWLLASEVIKTRKGSGEIHFQGNRYWSREMNAHMGEKVVIRFDPDALHEPVRVYDLKSRLICIANCIDDTGFQDQDKARQHARAAKEHRKALDAVAKSHVKLTAQQLGEIYYRGEKAPAKPKPVRAAVTRLVTGNTAHQIENVQAISDDDFEASFSRALGMIESGAVLPFPKGNTSASKADGDNEPKSSAYGSGKKKGGR